MWANSACSSRSKSSNPPGFDDAYFFSREFTRWGRSWSAVQTSRAVRLSVGVCDTSIGAALRSVSDLHQNILAEDHCPVFPSAPACRDKLSPAPSLALSGVFNKSIEFDHLDIVLDVSSRSSPVWCLVVRRICLPQYHVEINALDHRRKVAEAAYPTPKISQHTFPFSGSLTAWSGA